MQEFSFRLILVIFNNEPSPIKAPYGQRKRHQKFLKNKDKINNPIITFNVISLISKKNPSILTSEIKLYGVYKKAFAASTGISKIIIFTKKASSKYFNGNSNQVIHLGISIFFLKIFLPI